MLADDVGRCVCDRAVSINLLIISSVNQLVVWFMNAEYILISVSQSLCHRGGKKRENTKIHLRSWNQRSWTSFLGDIKPINL